VGDWKSFPLSLSALFFSSFFFFFCKRERDVNGYEGSDEELPLSMVEENAQGVGSVSFQGELWA